MITLCPKQFQSSTSSTLEHGGGTIKRHTVWALLLTICMTALIIPSSVGAAAEHEVFGQSNMKCLKAVGHDVSGHSKSLVSKENHVASDNNAKIGLKENKNVLEVNAAFKNAKTKSSRKVKASGNTSNKIKAKKTSKKSKRVKAANRYRKLSQSSIVMPRRQSLRGTTYRSYSSSSGSWSDDPALDAIMRSGAKYGHRRGISTAAAMQSAGAGDCWAMSEYLNAKFQEAGYQSRVIQYATSYSSRHRSVQVNRNGEWQTAPYRSYGYHYLFV